MCATGAQNTVQAEDISTMQQYDTEMQQQYANQQGIYAQVNSVLQPILQAGPDQQAFSTAETNTLNSQAVEGTATNYASAAKAVNEDLAAEGGGSEELPTGAQAEIKQEVANSAAQTESAQETQIQEADYQQGNQNFQNAEQGEMAIAAGDNPLGYASATTGAENAAGSESNAIATEDTSWINATLGAAGAVGGGWAAGGFKT